MNILKHFYEQQAAARPLVKEQAQALMTFVGTIPYSVPADVYSALARINCLMG